jgi:hypothetical protein
VLPTLLDTIKSLKESVEKSKISDTLIESNSRPPTLLLAIFESPTLFVDLKISDTFFEAEISDTFIDELQHPTFFARSKK